MRVLLMCSGQHPRVVADNAAHLVHRRFDRLQVRIGRIRCTIDHRLTLITMWMPDSMMTRTLSRRLLWEPWTGLNAANIKQQRAALDLINSTLLGTSLSQSSVLPTTKNRLTFSFTWSSLLPKGTQIHIRKLLGATIPSITSTTADVQLERHDFDFDSRHFSASWGTI